MPYKPYFVKYYEVVNKNDTSKDNEITIVIWFVQLGDICPPNSTKVANLLAIR